jgi:four helix bundle protein
MLLSDLMKKFILLDNLEVYQLSLQMSDNAWQVYNKLDWRLKKIIGDQFITAIDSVGANIAEGYGRYHYLDKIKFFYNSRGSLYESQHWLRLMNNRLILDQKNYTELDALIKAILIKLNSLISTSYKQKLSNY